jgi:cell division protein FtsZ
VQAAVAEAITHQEPNYGTYEDDGVTVEPYIPAAYNEHHEEPARRYEPPVPSAYVPSHAERPDLQRRMPRTDELPAVARRSLPGTERQDSEPKNARALFKRLASNVGINIGSGHDNPRDETTYSAADDAAARSAIEAGTPRTPQVSQNPDGAHGQLDAHGRAQPQPLQKDRLEIPAFLRKHG